MSSEDPDGISVLTASSSGIANVDVTVFSHSAILEEIEEAEKILHQSSITCCIADRDVPAGRFKIANAYSAASHGHIKVFVITKKFLEEDLKHHEPVLSDPKICTKENTLFLATGKHIRSLPGHLRRFESQNLQSEVSGRLIARFITKFRDKHYEQQDNVNSASTGKGEEKFQADECKEGTSHQRYLDIGIGSEYETKFKRFEMMFGKPDNKRAYILIASPITHSLPGLENIALIPWVRVFDFDPKSRVTGLLSVTESTLKKARHHTKTDRLDEIETPEDKVTNWVFINGYTDDRETLHLTNRQIDRKAIYKHALSLSEYCTGKKVHTVLVMWYAMSDDMVLNLDHFLSGIHLVFTGTLDSFNCVVCLERMPQNGSKLFSTLDRLELLDNTIVVPLNVLCKWLASSLHSTESKAKFMLPKFSDEEEKIIGVEIAEDEFNWIDVHFDLLISPSPKHEETDLIAAGETFLKGGEISWFIIGNDEFDVTRDLLKDAKTYLKDRHTSTGLTGMITIYHFPGGGGTTFGRRLLWEFREKNPCVELSSVKVNVEELRDRLMYLRQLTGLPIVLLADGKSDSDIKKIMDIGRDLPIIVIQVKRFYSKIKTPFVGDEKLYLPAVISESEATQLCKVYGKFVPDKRQKLRNLRSPKTGKVPALFEYGLTAFQSEFHGVRRYVHGYLRIQSEDELQPWHVVLAFLSIANYYGHRGMPSYLFGKILEKNSNEVVDLEDLPYAARQFITEDKYGNWKITHYIVSKEILEQIFVKRDCKEYTSSANQLSRSAKEQLCDWALKFIENVKVHVHGSHGLPSHVSEILTSIFIKRYYHDPGENEIDSKSHYSRLMEETDSKPDQRAILLKLVECFPSEPEFYAHLGRFYYKQAKFGEAVKCLTQAIEIRLKNVNRSNQSKGDDVLKRIYNMFGFCYNANVVHAIGARLGNVKEKNLANKTRPTLIRLCLEKAQKAIENFETGRKYYSKGSDPTFAYMGEIKVRLHLTELATVVSEGEGIQSLEKKNNPYKELHKFVMESFHECDHLLAQCMNYVSETDLSEDDITLCINKFQEFFKSAEAALEKWAGKDTSVKSKGCHISVIKMNLKRSSKGHRFRIYDDVQTKLQLMQLVDLYEGILDDVFKNENLNVRISDYMMEWLQAIRHPCITRQYSQSHVLSWVKRWEERNEMGSLATFYRYIITTLLSICSPRGKLANTYSAEASKLMEKFENHAIPLYLLNRSIEWVATSDSPERFNNIMHISEAEKINGKQWADKECLSKLQVCTGTIYRCKVYRGQIILDGGQNPQIVVFFVPQKFGIGASHSRQMTRVEFYLGFNPRHKAEAFKVTILHKYPCPECRAPTEVPRLGRERHLCTAPCNKCETPVYLPPKEEKC